MMLRKRGSGKGQLAGKVMSGAERDRQSMAIESGSRDGHGAGQVDAVPNRDENWPAATARPHHCSLGISVDLERRGLASVGAGILKCTNEAGFGTANDRHVEFNADVAGKPKPSRMRAAVAVDK